ncbi:MAG TPA: response regulator [Verrucomicrobiae bacterium]|jgi:CheY-like chemotaxis protein|nr:response regulator [Verrucomicrobiae bacterium]
MEARHKLLLLDDDEQMLEMYQVLLRELPSHPEVTVSNSGARAIALLESEPFTLLITDLRMPKMDGLQVLAIVRRKYPNLRIIVLTGVLDEEYRSRAYALGVDLFWHKPASNEEFTLFKDCIESFLGRDVAGEGGFRGMQSKSLVDLIQLECLSQSSSVLRITQGALEGKIWIKDGEVIDAAAADFKGEDAFKEIMSWKSGNFEILPTEPDRARTITNSYQGLLLDSVQAMDEWQGQQNAPAPTEGSPASANSGLMPLAKFDGVEFILTVPQDEKAPCESWAKDNVQQTAAWAREFQKRLRELGEKIGAGGLTQVCGFGMQRHWGLAGDDKKGLLCAGFRCAMPKEKVDQTMKQVFAKWVS